MAGLGSMLLGFLGAAMACLPRLLSDELKAWLPHLTEQIVSRAVDRAPERFRSRVGEEWRSHINDVPGDLGKLFVALSLLRAGTSMSDIDCIEEEMPRDLHEPSLDEILASIRRIIGEEQIPTAIGATEIPTPRDWGDPGPAAWPPNCFSSEDGRHHVGGGMAVFPSARYGGLTFQGRCDKCHKWIDSGDQYPD